jgi:hypothetical protein
MVLKSTFSLWLYLLAAIALADQTASSRDNTSFAFKNTMREENYKACCSDSKPTTGTSNAGET